MSVNVLSENSDQIRTYIHSLNQEGYDSKMVIQKLVESGWEEKDAKKATRLYNKDILNPYGRILFTISWSLYFFYSILYLVVIIIYGSRTNYVSRFTDNNILIDAMWLVPMVGFVFALIRSFLNDSKPNKNLYRKTAAWFLVFTILILSLRIISI